MVHVHVRVRVRARVCEFVQLHVCGVLMAHAWSNIEVASSCATRSAFSTVMSAYMPPPPEGLYSRVCMCVFIGVWRHRKKSLQH